MLAYCAQDVHWKSGEGWSWSPIPGQDPGFSNRGGATSHTHMWAWLRFCIATASPTAHSV